ncbi:MAG: response regulator, partial [Clostridiales bacterium]|nr:response regulator [Clostridiales bacterium]
MKQLLSKQTKAIALKLLFVALAFFVMAVLSYTFISSIVRVGMLRSANSVLDFAQMRIDKSTEEAHATLNGYAEAVRGMVVQGASEEEIDQYMQGLFYYMNTMGDSVIHVDGFYGYFETLSDAPILIQQHKRAPFDPDKAVSEQPWYFAALSAKGKIVEMPPQRSAVGEVFVTYAKSIFDGQGSRLGICRVDLRINDVSDEVVHMALNQGDYGMLIDQDFVIMAHPNPDFNGNYVYNSNMPIAVLYDDMRAGRNISEHDMVSYRNEEAVGFFRKLDNGWYLGLVSPKAQYYQSTTNMAVIICLLAAALAAALGIILIRVDSQRVRSDEESRQKSAFLANMSHEIRTPINAIVGMTTLGKNAESSERKDYCFSKITDASNHLLGVINDILDISKIEANKIDLSDVPFRFEKMLQHAVNVINFRVEERRQSLSVHIDRKIPKTIIADDQRFAQVITNLLSNAVKFTPEEGRISLRATLTEQSGDDLKILIEVTDSGIGISPEQQAKLFRSFQQAEYDTARKYGGTGLGLAISKGIVSLMGGEIWVRSENGKGSTFGFTVKVKRGQNDPDETVKQNIDWSTIRLLAVDDDLDILHYFQEIVSSLGVNCEIAGDAATALRLIEQNGAYDVYFVDLKMPDVDGVELTKQIRAKEKEKAPGNSVVVMISAYDLNSIEKEAKQAGVDKFIVKPLFPSSIADAISECVGFTKAVT